MNIASIFMNTDNYECLGSDVEGNKPKPATYRISCLTALTELQRVEQSDDLRLTIKTTCVLPSPIIGLAYTENSTYLLPSLYNRHVEN
jgi:hypothetical protein